MDGLGIGRLPGSVPSYQYRFGGTEGGGMEGVKVAERGLAGCNDASFMNLGKKS